MSGASLPQCTGHFARKQSLTSGGGNISSMEYNFIKVPISARGPPTPLKKADGKCIRQILAHPASKIRTVT